MDFSDRVLGSTIAHKLQDRVSSVLLRIGRDTFTRGDLAHVECFNFVAAANLSAILNRELQVKDTAEVFHHIAPAALALPRLGAVALAVLGAAFEVKGLGGDHPLERWVRNHTEHHTDAEIVTFGSLKQRQENTHAGKRRTGRRVSRFTSRHKKAS
jgi:hypothetical protein